MGEEKVFCDFFLHRDFFPCWGFSPDDRLTLTNEQEQLPETENQKLSQFRAFSVNIIVSKRSLKSKHSCYPFLVKH